MSRRPDDGCNGAALHSRPAHPTCGCALYCSVHLAASSSWLPDLVGTARLLSCGTAGAGGGAGGRGAHSSAWARAVWAAARRLCCCVRYGRVGVKHALQWLAMCAPHAGQRLAFPSCYELRRCTIVPQHGEMAERWKKEAPLPHALWWWRRVEVSRSIVGASCSESGPPQTVAHNSCVHNCILNVPQ